MHGKISSLSGMALASHPGCAPFSRIDGFAFAAVLVHVHAIRNAGRLVRLSPLHARRPGPGGRLFANSDSIELFYRYEKGCQGSHFQFSSSSPRLVYYLSEILALSANTTFKLTNGRAHVGCVC